jgi:hypothetical protein
MNILTPNLCLTPGARVVGNTMYDGKDPRALTQDLMLVELSNHTYIDVSWFPEHDSAGAYFVSVIRAREKLHEIETKSSVEALFAVEALAVVFSEIVGNVSCSAGQTKTIECSLRPAA